jgi:hypothetical protein
MANSISMKSSWTCQPSASGMKSHFRAAAADLYKLIASTKSKAFRWLTPAVFKPSLAADLAQRIPPHCAAS